MLTRKPISRPRTSRRRSAEAAGPRTSVAAKSEVSLTDIPAEPPGGAVAPRAAPPHLRAAIERRAMVDLSDVRVRYNSEDPEAHDAAAFARGADVHVAPGAEKHLPHELWHVAQQKQGRVAATGRNAGVLVNTDPVLEREAETQGVGAGLSTNPPPPPPVSAALTEAVTQLAPTWPGRRRKTRGRSAKRKWAPRRNAPRGGIEKVRIREGYTARAKARFDTTTDTRVKRAARRGAFRARPEFDPLSYAKYPSGSYGRGRFQYLMGQLSNLGSLPNQLLDFDNAPVEIDHSPQDGSQRKGQRKADEASMYRVAVPLPRAWHRRHKTTSGGKRLDRTFVADQRDLVKNGRYHEALQNHLLETLSNEAIGATGAAKVQQVLGHMDMALNYAASNIPVSLHARHKANTPVISGPEAAGVRLALRNQVNVLKGALKFAGLNNPF